MPTPPANATRTTMQAGTYNPLTDTFTSVLDLNDGVTFFLMNKSLQMQQPARVDDKSENARNDGQLITASHYQNRKVQFSFTIRPQASSATVGARTADLLASVRSFLAACPFNRPFVLRFAAPGAANYSYFDVVSVTHDLEADPQRILNGHIKGKVIFEAYPFIRGDRLWLSNLVTNPGFEMGNGPGVTVFTDTFANVNAYTSVAGAVPTVAANLMTVANGAVVSFGSPAWGAINTWQVRFKYVTGLFVSFDAHFTDASNKIQFQVGNGSMGIFHYVGGGAHTLATSAPALTNGNFYWVKITQFPAISGDAPYLTFNLFNDTAGAVGSAVVSGALAGAAFDAVTAVSGKLAIEASGAAAQIGGAFSNVHTVALFGPGAWLFTPTSATTGQCAGAWEQSTANTYPSGPVTSYGAARIDLPPAGTVNAFWSPYSGGAPAGGSAMPVSAVGNVMAASAYAKSTGLGVAATIVLTLQEYDSSGAFLRQTILQTLTGNQSAWTKMSGTVTTGANCAYASIVLNAADSNAGASANGVVWFDNAQAWNQTTTGQTSMPYCELRLNQSPAQFMVSGVLGDVPTPAWTALGTYYATPASTTVFRFALGRKATTIPGAQLVVAASDFATSAVLDNTAWGGFYGFVHAQFMVPTVFAPTTNNILGVYNLYSRYQTAQILANLPNVSCSAIVKQATATFRSGSQTVTGSLQGTQIYPVTAVSTWEDYEMGQLTVPLSATGSLVDPTTTYTFIVANWVGPSVSDQLINWALLLPVDGALVKGSFTFGTLLNSFTNQFWIVYIDGLGSITSNAPSTANAGWTWSHETTSVPSPGHSAGAPLGNASFAPILTSGAAPFMDLDPTQTGGVNQFAGYITDQLAAVLPMYLDLQYSPLFLDPR